MVWIKTFKKTKLPEYVHVIKGKIVETSNDVGVSKARDKWLSQKSVKRLKKVM